MTVYVFPVAEEQDRAEVWLAPRTILAGVRVQVKPAGETAEVSATVPVKPFTGATVTVEVAAVPAVVVTLLGLAATVKSFTVYVTVVVFVVNPLLAPETVTV